MLKLGGPLVCLCLLGAAAYGADAQLHVAPGGNDANPGTANKPVATLERARQLIAALRAGGDGRIDVLVHPGTYRLSKTLNTGPDDTSPRTKPARTGEITFRRAGQGEVVLSGGREIRGWTPQGKLWIVDVPGVKETTWLPRQLYINGQFRPRAPTPNRDFYHGMNSTDVKTIRKVTGTFKLAYVVGDPPIFNEGDVFAVVIFDPKTSMSFVGSMRINDIDSALLNVQDGLVMSCTLTSQSTYTVTN